MNLLTITFVLLVVSFVNAAVPNVRLNNGKDMPILGLGTSQAKGNDLVQAIKDALQIGYRMIDTAKQYGNEKEVGQGVAEAIKAGIVKREDVFVTSKVEPDTSSNQTKYALDTVRASLSLMGFTYIDLYLVHHPRNDYINAYKGLEEAYNQGLVKSIGVSNFNNTQVENLLKVAKIKPVNNQIPLHPDLPEKEQVDYCFKNNISVTAYSPLGRASLLSEPIVLEVAKLHNKTAAQILLRYDVQQGVITIPKSVHKEHIEENFNIFDFTLTEADIQNLEKMKH